MDVLYITLLVALALMISAVGLLVHALWHNGFVIFAMFCGICTVLVTAVIIASFISGWHDGILSVVSVTATCAGMYGIMFWDDIKEQFRKFSRPSRSRR